MKCILLSERRQSKKAILTGCESWFVSSQVLEAPSPQTIRPLNSQDLTFQPPLMHLSEGTMLIRVNSELAHHELESS